MKKVLLKLSVFILTVALTGTPVLAASLSDFSDVGSHWASEALGRAVSDGVLNGSGGKLNPDGTLTGAGNGRHSGAANRCAAVEQSLSGHIFCRLVLYGVLPQRWKTEFCRRTEVLLRVLR